MTSDCERRRRERLDELWRISLSEPKVSLSSALFRDLYEEVVLLRRYFKEATEYNVAVSLGRPTTGVHLAFVDEARKRVNEFDARPEEPDAG